MFRNYVVTALRNLIRDRLYAAINIAGLAIGFTAAALIGLYVRDEMHFDRFWPEHEDVFRLAKVIQPPQAPPLRSDGSSPSEAAWLRLEVPEILATTRLWPTERGVRRGAVEATETVIWADPETSEVLPLTALEGDVASALRSPDAVVLTRESARKYFGRGRVVGETIELDRKLPLRVAAVIEDPPPETHLRISMLASSLSASSPFAAFKQEGVGLGPVFTYFRIRRGTLAAVEAELPGVIDRHVPPGMGDASMLGSTKSSEIVRYVPQPISAIHMLAPNVQGTTYGMLKPAGDSVLLSYLSATGLLILLVASVNFVNLTTARSARRAIEVGVRKTAGAHRRDLIVQFMGEACLYVACAVALAGVLVWLLLPSFGAYFDHRMALGGHDLPLVAGILPAALLLSMVAGFYPALLLSARRPATALKAGAAAAGPDGPRRLLVTLQFAALIGLVVAAASISRQATFAMQSSFRLNADPLLLVATSCETSFRDRAAALPGVRGAACTGGMVPNSGGAYQLLALPDGSRMNLETVNVSPGLLELFGIRPLAGRSFTEAQNDVVDVNSARVNPQRIVINETAMHRLGFTTARTAIGRALPSWNESEIIGVVPDFPDRSVRERVGPTAFVLGSRMTHLVIQLDGTHIPEALRGIDQLWEKAGTGRPIARQFYDQVIQAQYLGLVRQGQAFAALVAIGILIACLGLFGLAAFIAETRTKEIGIRKAMGASRLDVLRMLLWHFAKPVLWANLIAWPVAGYLMHRWLEGFAYHVDLDPLIFIGASAVALAIALATVIGHALLVARARPVAALRYE